MKVVIARDLLITHVSQTHNASPPTPAAATAAAADAPPVLSAPSPPPGPSSSFSSRRSATICSTDESAGMLQEQRTGRLRRIAVAEAVGGWLAV
jgi:hypothetical protein